MLQSRLAVSVHRKGRVQKAVTSDKWRAESQVSGVSCQGLGAVARNAVVQRNRRYSSALNPASFRIRTARPRPMSQPVRTGMVTETFGSACHKVR